MAGCASVPNSFEGPSCYPGSLLDRRGQLGALAFGPAISSPTSAGCPAGVGPLSAGLRRQERQPGEVSALGVLRSSRSFGRIKAQVRIHLFLEPCEEGSAGRLGVGEGIDFAVEGVRGEFGSEGSFGGIHREVSSAKDCGFALALPYEPTGKTMLL